MSALLKLQSMLPKTLLQQLNLPGSVRRTVLPLFRFTAALSLATFAIYIAGNTVSFIVQLFELSSAEVIKFTKVVAALLNRPTLDLEFLPQEFEDLSPNAEGAYSYAPGTYHPLLFRRSPSTPGAWEWSEEGSRWFATDSFRESPNGVPEPPALVFILRLHVEHLIRRRMANPAAAHRRLPPPLQLDGVPAGHLDAAPDVLCCPISHGLMRLPVVAPSGTTFEYDSIRKWAQLHNTDPVNGAPLTEGDLYPNLALRDIIERWLRHGARRAAASRVREGAAAAEAAAAAAEVQKEAPCSAGGPMESKAVAATSPAAAATSTPATVTAAPEGGGTEGCWACGSSVDASSGGAAAHPPHLVDLS